jgi:hypothetical protein
MGDEFSIFEFGDKSEDDLEEEIDGDATTLE